MTDTESKKKNILDGLMETGTDIAGQVAGGAIGFFTGGLPGAMIGGVTGTLLSKVFIGVAKEIKNRLLGKREEVRIGATFAFATIKIKENMNNGNQIRDDDFFKEKPNERSDAEEIVEGVLLAAQREHEEKKIKYFGNLLANIAFHPEIDKAQANLLLKVGSGLSYRQICLISFFINNNNYNLRQTSYREWDKATMTYKNVSLLQEIYDMYLQGLIHCSGEAMLGLSDVNPAKIAVQGTGNILYKLMELWQVDSEYLSEIALLLT